MTDSQYPKFFRKLRLYCILHNSPKWFEIPYTCWTCNKKNKASICQENITIRFASDEKCKHFFRQEHYKYPSHYGYVGCDKWKKK